METLPEITLEVRATTVEADGTATLRLMPIPEEGGQRLPINYGEPGIVLSRMPFEVAGLGGRCFRAVLTLVPVEAPTE